MVQPKEWCDQVLCSGQLGSRLPLVTTVWWDGRVYAHCHVCYEVNDPNGTTFETSEHLIEHLERHRAHGSFPPGADAAAVAAAAKPAIGSVWSPPPNPAALIAEAREMLDLRDAYAGRRESWIARGGTADAHWLEDFNARVRGWKEKVDALEVSDA